MVPLYLLGPSRDALDAYVIIAAIQAVFVHANVGIPFGRLRYVLVTPQFHHWHHSKDGPAIDTNYGVHTPLWDWVFGTADFERHVFPPTGVPDGPEALATGGWFRQQVVGVRRLAQALTGRS